MKDAADAALAAQYDAYPYPQRDPRDEAKRLIIGSPSHLREVDHWIFGARRPASQRLRALVAGGGSGDATVMLAQQMASAGRAGDVTWLDRSAAARRVAEARVAARKPARIPAPSPSKASTGSGTSFQASCICSSVSAVPSGATASITPARARPTTSI